MAAEPPQPPQNLAQAISEVSERAALLVHDEIELAKTEVFEKLAHVRNAAIVGAAAGIFVVVGLFFALEAFAWLISRDVIGGNDYFGGFLVLSFILFILAAVFGLLAAKAVRRGAPPVPVMAIDEARKIRQAVSAPESS